MFDKQGCKEVQESEDDAKITSCYRLDLAGLGSELSAVVAEEASSTLEEDRPEEEEKQKGDQIECKNLLDNAKNSLDSMTDIHQSIYSHYYWVLSQYHKSRREFAEFYKSLFLYVPFDPVEPVSNPFKQ
ncbi:26S proteasome non-ATPase regulatory subunit 13 homolog B-like protein, partial [Tanacetum coccineum]